MSAGWLILGVFYVLVLVFVWSLMAAASMGDDQLAELCAAEDDE